MDVLLWMIVAFAASLGAFSLVDRWHQKHAMKQAIRESKYMAEQRRDYYFDDKSGDEARVLKRLLERRAADAATKRMKIAARARTIGIRGRNLRRARA